jgi:molecular chaperone GrpE
MTRHRIPVRVGTMPVSTRSVYQEAPAEQAQRRSPDPRLGPDEQPKTAAAPAETEDNAPAHDVSEGSEWRDRALRLQAEMDNYRKRQRRVAQQEAQAGQERLLRDVLGVADNLERSLAAARQSPNGPGTPDRRSAGALRRGVELTRDELLRVLANHGLERFGAMGEPFDPAWHEAVHVVSARALGVEPGTVVEEIQPGYRKHDAVHGERLFRPAQVVVAN